MRLSKALPRQDLRQLAEDTRGRLEQFKEYVPIIMAVCNPGMRGRHWERLSSTLGQRVYPGGDAEVNLQKLLTLGISQHADFLQVRGGGGLCVQEGAVPGSYIRIAVAVADIAAVGARQRPA